MIPRKKIYPKNTRRAIEMVHKVKRIKRNAYNLENERSKSGKSNNEFDRQNVIRY